MQRTPEPLIVLGRDIGTFTGWDQIDDDMMVFYDYTPHVSVGLPSGDLFVSYGAGLVMTYDDDGQETSKNDLIDAIGHVTRKG